MNKSEQLLELSNMHANNGNEQLALDLLLEVPKEHYEQYVIASFNIGFFNLRRKNYTEAIRRYKVSLEGWVQNSTIKMVYGPIGQCYFELGQYQNSIKYYELVLEHSAQPFDYVDITALFNIGVSHSGLGNHKLALEFYFKVKDFYRDPLIVRYYIGSTLMHLNLYFEAIKYFNEIIGYKNFEFFDELNLELSRAYSETQQPDLARRHAFVALLNNPNKIKTIRFISERYSSDRSNKFYLSRNRFLLESIERRNFDETNLFLESIEDLVKKAQTETSSESLFTVLLSNMEVSIPLELPNNDRIRLAYLISFKSHPEQTFFILENNEILKNSTDYYFLFLSAYMTGEPVHRLRNIIEAAKKEISKEDVQFSAIQKLIAEFYKAIDSDNWIDEYLLDFDVNKALTFIEFREADSDFIVQATRDIVENRSDFEIPLSRNQLIGLMTQLYPKIAIPEDDLEILTSWNNLKMSIAQPAPNYLQIFDNIREAIKSDVPSTSILPILFSFYSEQIGMKERKKIVILQATTIYSEYWDKLTLKNLSSIERKKGLTEFILEEGISSLINLGLGGKVGIILSLHYLYKRISESNDSNLIFEELKAELI